MRYAAIALALLFGAASSTVAETKIAIEHETIETIEFGDVEIEVALEYLRSTETRILRRINDDPSVVLKFDYHFDPLKSRDRITLNLEDTTFFTALSAVTSQAGLKWAITKESILIVDDRASDPSP